MPLGTGSRSLFKLACMEYEGTVEIIALKDRDVGDSAKRPGRNFEEILRNNWRKEPVDGSGTDG
jgi:hypothetical protein